MIFQIFIILGLAGIFVILVRKFPATAGVSNLPWPPRLPKIQIPTLPKFKFQFKIPVIKLGLPRFKKKIEEPMMITEEALIAQADLAFSNQDFALAEKLYIQAATQHPKNAKIYARLGVIYLRQKNYKDARDALLSSLRFDSKVASRHYNLALVYQELGNFKKALAEVKQALSLDPTNEKYETLRQKLEG